MIYIYISYPLHSQCRTLNFGVFCETTAPIDRHTQAVNRKHDNMEQLKHALTVTYMRTVHIGVEELYSWNLPASSMCPPILKNNISNANVV